MRTRRIALALVASLLLAALRSGVSAADTSGDLKAAKDRLATLQSELTRLAGEWSAAQTRLAVTQSKLADTRASVDHLRAHMADLQDRIGMTARIAYESGGTGAFTSLLSSGSFTEFSERMEFMDRITAADADLVVAARVTREDLRREQRALTTLAAEQASAVAELQAQKEAIDSRLSEVSALVDTLRLRLAAAAARNHGPPPPGGLPLQACPLPGSSFTDDFGAPRPGGRTHQGIDMLAPFGTPIHAAQSGRFQQDYNDLGGISALVYAGNGDFTYYAHMEGYAGVGNGATVSAGAVIGYVGNTGDAQGGPPHLHFEYHPGGGGAVDPYSYLVALC